MTDFLPDYLLFVIGLGLLLGAAEGLVRGTAKVARLIGKSSLFIGLTITAFGTSAPELVVGISGQLTHNSDIGLGNIVGSNIFNIFFVLGLAALIRPIIVSRPAIWRDIPILLLVSILFFLFASNGTVGAVESILLLITLILYLYYLARISGERPEASSDVSVTSAAAKAPVNLPSTLLWIVASIAAMAFGAHMVVAGAVSIAANLGVTELVSGLTIVAVGTSLPEIATTVAAVRKGEHELAIGNVIGSCLFNMVAVPAGMALVGTGGLAVSVDALTIDIPVMILAVIVCLPVFFSGHRISRYEGALFLLYYLVYFLLLYSRSISDSYLNQYQTELAVFAIAVIAVTIIVIAYRTTRYYRRDSNETDL